MTEYEYDVSVQSFDPCQSALKYRETKISADEELKAQRQPERDPLLALAGTLTSDGTNISERHDEYIGQALLKEMRDADNE